MAGLRERQKAGRREDILKAAGLLFQRDGFAATSIEQTFVAMWSHWARLSRSGHSSIPNRKVERCGSG